MKLDHALLIGLFMTFSAGVGTGYIVGHGATVTLPPPAIPSNYDPMRAFCADALKEQQALTARCWQDVLAERDRELKRKDP